MSVGRTECPEPARPYPRSFLEATRLDDGADVLFNDTAVEQVDAAIGVRRVARIVRHHADGGAAAMQLAEEIHDGFAVLRIKVTGRFVRQQDRRLAGDGAGAR